MKKTSPVRDKYLQFKRESDGVPWLVIAEARGISYFRFRKRLEEGYTPEEAADLSNLTLAQRRRKMFEQFIRENGNE